VQKKPVRRAEPGSHSVAEPQSWELEFAEELPDVPVMLETILRLELEAQEPSADLRAMAQLVLSDLGATVQILRLSGQQHGNAQDRPTRIEDCISALGLSACMEAVSAQAVAHDSRFKAIAETWAHSREIAQHSMLVAGEMPDVNPDEAYMVGLLHAIGALPPVLGWYGSEGRTADGARAGFQMAKQWLLPHFALEYFSEMQRGKSTTPWPEIVSKAHRSAGAAAAPCPVERGNRPLLHRAV
jgi:hypothetical protein